MKRILIYFLSYILIQLITGAVVMSFIHDTATQLIVSGTVSNFLATALFLHLEWCPHSTRFFTRESLVTAYWCVMLSVGMIIPLQGIEELIPKAWRTDIAADMFKAIMDNGWGYVMIGIFAPIGEEIVFRGAIQRRAVNYFRMRGMSGWVGIFFTSVLFAAVHANPAQMPHAFIVGMIMGWLCYSSGSVLPGIIVHWANNSISFGLQALYPQSYDMNLFEFFSDSHVRLVTAVIMSLMLFIPAIVMLHKTFNDEEW